MADINLEKKGRSGIWGWVIALIILLIVLWAIFGRRHEPARTMGTSSTETPASAISVATATALVPGVADAA